MLALRLLRGVFKSLPIPICYQNNRLQVFGPTVPSTGRPRSRWNFFTARSVPVPYTVLFIKNPRYPRLRKRRFRMSTNSAARVPFFPEPRRNSGRRYEPRRTFNHVAGPTTPSAFKSCVRWKYLTFSSNLLPNDLLMLTPNRAARRRTSASTEPCRSVLNGQV
jgi:hypothetical protein